MIIKTLNVVYLFETKIVDICMYILVTSEVLYFRFLQWVTGKGIGTLITKPFLRIYCVHCIKLFETFVNTVIRYDYCDYME